MSYRFQSIPLEAGPDERREVLARLRRYLVHADPWGNTLGPEHDRVMKLGVAAIDAALPWGGLPLGCLHEIAGSAEDGAATGFAAFLLGRLAVRGRTVAWIADDDSLHGPGLAALGLGPEQLIVIAAHRPAEALWAMETALRCRDLEAVMVERRGAMDFVNSRRLQLAARASGVTGIVLCRGTAEAAATASVTSWEIASAPLAAGAGSWRPRWRVTLARCRGRIQGEAGYVDRWCLDGQDAPHSFAVAPGPLDRPIVTAAAGLAR
jgi:protein ImuA